MLFLYFLAGHAQYSHSGIKTSAFHAQDLGCTARPGDLPSRSLEHVANVPSLNFFQRGEVGKGVIYFFLHFGRQFRDSSLDEAKGGLIESRL